MAFATIGGFLRKVAGTGQGLGALVVTSDSTDPLVVDSVPLAGDNRKVVTTAGTRVALATTTACKWVQVTAETDNTGMIVVGGSTVVAALATRRGTPLNAGDSITIPTTDLASVYIDSTVNGDGVTFIYG